MRYPGGKGSCFRQLINLMPVHDVYIESHLGGGAVMRHKIPAKTNIGIDIDPAVVRRWLDGYPDRFTIVHANAVEYLASYPYTGSELVYCDPPYLPQLRRRSRVYRFDYTEADHLALLDVLLRTPCSVMLSGYESNLYNDRLREWRQVKFMAKTHVGLKEECVWVNFDPPKRLHDAAYLGDTFRDRQSVKRRHERMLRKFSRMCPRERSYLLELLNDRFLTGVPKP
jgi:DNA adenine methylase